MIKQFSFKRTRRGKLACAAVFVACGALAQSGGGFDIRRSVIAGGGGQAAGGDFSLTGTAGQPATQESAGGDFVVRAGFWAQENVVRPELIFANGFE
ncbi:MAG: hypothetical protein AAF358_02505 [Pseudomonadota bacterium]